MNAIEQWIALVDAAETIMHSVPCWGQEQYQQMHQALDALLIHEHNMTESERETARRQLRQRDYPDQPLPTETATFRLCHCHACLFARRLGRLSQAFIQASTLKPPAPPHIEATQGDLFPCI